MFNNDSPTNDNLMITNQWSAQRLQKKIEKFKLNKNSKKCENQTQKQPLNPLQIYDDSECENDNDDDDDNIYLISSKNEVQILKKPSSTMSATTSARPSPATTPLYDGYATIRGRGLTRSLSIRAKELEAAQEQEKAAAAEVDSEEVTVRQYVITTPGERKRTISLRSDYSQTSPFRSDANKMSQSLYQPSLNSSNGPGDIYISRSNAKPVKTPTISDMEPLYATAANSTFRPLSDASSSSGGANSGSGCRDSVVGSSGSGSINVDYHSLKKNSRFSLDSLHSSNTPKTPDYTTADEDQIFLYTAPDSPKRRLDSGIRNSYDESSEREYSPLNKQSFEMQEYPRIRTPSEHSQSSHSHSPAKSRRPSTVSLNYKRTQSLGDYSKRPLTLMTSSFQRSDSESPTYSSRPPPSPSHKPPPTPVRRESLYAKPKIYTSTHKSPSLMPLEVNSSKLNSYQLPSPPQRSSSAEILERSYTSHSLATIDQDEILAVPSAMPVLQNPVDRRYHTLGHMRVQSLGSSLHRTPDSPMGSLVNMMSGAYYTPGGNHLYSNLHPNKSAGNIYASAEAAVEDLNKLAPEYMDPLDFKIGCQTTLRSKPIIPWYELAIKRDLSKRQSCPPISSSLHVNGTQTLSAARSIFPVLALLKEILDLRFIHSMSGFLIRKFIKSQLFYVILCEKGVSAGDTEKLV
ncbi:hypothetical protein CVS40_8752 [Lucilia cuprina]|nr:hypothetical protein CVS40_8752 [Lucilia cuprina]